MMRYSTVILFSLWASQIHAQQDKLDDNAGLEVDLRGTNVTTAKLRELTKVRQLHSLNLAGTHVTDAGLKELAGLTQLRTLNLRGTKVSDDGLKELVGMKRLQVLDLFGGT